MDFLRLTPTVRTFWLRTSAFILNPTSKTLLSASFKCELRLVDVIEGILYTYKICKWLFLLCKYGSSHKNHQLASHIFLSCLIVDKIENELFHYTIKCYFKLEANVKLD